MDILLIIFLVSILLLVIYKVIKNKNRDGVPVKPKPPRPEQPDITKLDYVWIYNDHKAYQDSNCGRYDSRYKKCDKHMEPYPDRECSENTVGNTIGLEPCCADEGISVEPYWECIKRG